MFLVKFLFIFTVIEMDVHLPHHFTARDYQGLRLRVLEQGKKRAVWVWHRRAGKDKTALAGFTVPQMLQRRGVYFHWFPTTTLGRKIAWDGTDYEGFPFLGHFPKELIARKNDNEMKLTLKNGSIYQIVGTDRMEIVGPNPVGNIFSEYPLQNPKGWDYCRPILAENNGWAIFVYTPRGRNHGYKLYKMALNNPNWDCSLLTVDNTHAITQEAIDEDRASGMTEDMIQQEYYCSWQLGAEGAFYALAMSEAAKEGRIVDYAIDPHCLVDTFWDLGIGGTAIWFVQFIGRDVRLVDFYSWFGPDIGHYVDIIRSKGYRYGKHWAPPDVNKKEFGTGTTTFREAAKMGLEFSVLPKEKNIFDGIQRVLGMLPYCWFHLTNTEEGVNAIEQYHKEYNDKFRVYNDNPCHDWTSHPADALRYVSMVFESGATRGESQTLEQIQSMEAMSARPM